MVASDTSFPQLKNSAPPTGGWLATMLWSPLLRAGHVMSHHTVTDSATSAPGLPCPRSLPTAHRFWQNKLPATVLLPEAGEGLETAPHSPTTPSSTVHHCSLRIFKLVHPILNPYSASNDSQCRPSRSSLAHCPSLHHCPQSPLTAPTHPPPLA
jgi:hypothetical protein